MYSRIKCANPLVLQEICDRLNEMKVQYLAEVPLLELYIKSQPDIIARLIEEHGYDAHLLVNA